MKTGEETALFVLGLMEAAYKRPLMYGQSGDTVDGLMHFWHSILGFILDRKDEFSIAEQKAAEADGCPAAMSFSRYYRNHHSNASEEEIARYVVTQWQNVDQLLGLEFPQSQIAEVWDHYNKGAG